jgi:hypothetical protein
MLERVCVVHVDGSFAVDGGLQNEIVPPFPPLTDVRSEDHGQPLPCHSRPPGLRAGT